MCCCLPLLLSLASVSKLLCLASISFKFLSMRSRNLQNSPSFLSTTYVSLFSVAIKTVILFLISAQILTSIARKRPRIFLGRLVKQSEVDVGGQFEFVVALSLIEKKGEKEETTTCSGSLVSPFYILTAAHCFCYENAPVKFDEIRVSLCLSVPLKDSRKFTVSLTEGLLEV